MASDLGVPEPGAWPRRQRAKPLAPEQRRDAIIAATIPLLRTHGLEVTTRQIAEAAGVAEGTLFRVFDDKESLLRQVVLAVLDPTETESRLQDVDLALPLDERIGAAAEILRQRLLSVIELATAVGFGRFPDDEDARQRHQERMLSLLTRLFEPDRDRLRVDPVEAARQLQMVSFAAAHPKLNHGVTMTADEVVALLLDGVRLHRGETGSTRSDPMRCDPMHADMTGGQKRADLTQDDEDALIVDRPGPSP